MRGPSSSHCVAALRIGRLARDLMGGELEEVVVQFDRYGALATTHLTQGSDMGLWAGLLGWDPDDERMPDSARAIREAGVRVQVEIADLRDPHPNTYRISLRGAARHHTVRAISTGGGMIELVGIDEFPVSIEGDYYETLIRVDGDGAAVAARIAGGSAVGEVLVHESAAGELVEVKGPSFVPEAVLESLRAEYPIRDVYRLRPVLPVLSRKNLEVLFCSCEQMLRYDAGRMRPLWKLAVEYESVRGHLSGEEVVARMENIVRLLRRSVQQGIDGTSYEERILGHQCGKFQQLLERRELIDAGVLNRIVLYVSALMEVKSSMGVIVAAPTAGACATLPGACLAVADQRGLADEPVARAMLAAGLVGVFIASRSTFAAEVAGCQAECGAAASMTAAALVELAGGTARQALAAASMALQNSLGMVCDPVASRVEVPCLGKNVMAASNALACANMALADYDPVIPLDEVIAAADQVGRSLPRELRCTGLGGLAATRTARQIESRLSGRQTGLRQ
ncbi:MAG TPA: serine dehydratase [Planctomycetaceae bacterium]|nr:serine dehydratase [Planctomycetaceae bacterium]